MRIRYLIREAFFSLSRNALVVLGAILAAFLSLALTLNAVVLSEVVRSNTSRWEDGVRLVAFLQSELSFSAVAALSDEVRSWDGVSEVIYFSKSDALVEAQEMFRDDPELLEVIEDDPTVLPASLRIKPEDTENYSTMADRLAATPGVMEVQRGDEAIEQLRDLKTILTRGSVGAAVVLALVAVALIANTIRMAIYSRREEIGIMKLVGAGNWFVRIPFLLEGMIEGLVGAVLAVGVMLGLYRLGLDLQGALPEWIDLDVPVDFLLRWSVLTLIGGIVVGVVGSGIAVRRFLQE